jgi:hypothetical protein
VATSSADPFSSGYALGNRHGREVAARKLQLRLAGLLGGDNIAPENQMLADRVLAAVAEVASELGVVPDVDAVSVPDSDAEPVTDAAPIPDQTAPAEEAGNADEWPSPEVQEKGNRHDLDTPLGTIGLTIGVYNILTREFGSTIRSVLTAPERLLPVLDANGCPELVWAVDAALKGIGYDIDPRVTSTWPPEQGGKR